MNIDIDKKNVDINTSKNDITISFGNNTLETSIDKSKIEFQPEQKRVDLKFGINRIQTGGTQDHSELENLDYEHSGHTGFQPSGDYALRSEIPDVSQFITRAVSDLLNYYSKSETYTKEEVNNLISQIQQMSFLVVEELPEIGESNIIYLVPKEIPNTSNIYEEYIYVSNQWEKIGSTEIDLTDYVKNTDYMTGTTGGVGKANSVYFIQASSSGFIFASDRTYQQYNDASRNAFVGKGTLENVLNGKGLNEVWKKEEITEYPLVPDNSKLYVYRQAGINPFYTWMYQNQTGQKFIKNPSDNLIDTPVSLNNEVWNITNQIGGYYLSSNNTYMYQQFGSSSKSYSQLTLESETEFENVNSIDVYSAGGSHSGNYHIWCEVSIYDSENDEWIPIGKQDVGLLTNSACNKLTFENNTGIENGKIKVEFTQNTTKAIYLGGIVLNTIMPVSPTFRIYADGNWYIVNTMENTITKEYADSNFANDLGQIYTEDENPDLSYSDGEIFLLDKNGNQLGNRQKVKWSASAGNTIYSHKSQYDIDNEPIRQTYAHSMDLQDKTLTLYAKDHEETREVYNEETGEYEEITEEVPTILSQVELPSGSELNYANINIPRIEARSLMSSAGNVIRLFIKDITPEFIDYVDKNGNVQLHLFKYVKTQTRVFIKGANDRVKHNEKKWIHPANEVCYGSKAVGKQCWGVASIIPSLLAHAYTEDDYYDYIDSVDYNVYNGGVVESEINITKTDLLRGHLDINLNDLMSCLLVIKGRNAQHPSLNFIPFEGDGNEVKIIGCKQTNMCPVMKQPIKYRLAVPYENSKGYTDYLYGDSNTIILECAMTRIIRGDELGYGQNRTNRILPDVGYGIKIKQ